MYDSLSISKLTFLAKGMFQEYVYVVVMIVVPTGIYSDDDDITNIVS